MINISLAFGFLFSWVWYYLPVRAESLYLARVFDIGVVALTAILAYVFLKLLKVRSNHNHIATLLIALGNVALAVRILFHTYRTFYPPAPFSVDEIMAQGDVQVYINAMRMPAIILIIVGLVIAFASNKQLKHDAL
jgi:hypothetical protein